MQRYLINYFSAGEFIFVLMVLILCIALTMSFLSKRYFSSLISPENNNFISFFIGSISASYGFILGFIIVSLWRELYEVRTFVTQEAEHLALLVYSAPAFPSAIQSEIISGVEQYIRILIQEEWPLMRIGEVSTNAVPSLTNLFRIIHSYSPETLGETASYNQFISNLNKMIEFRRGRIEFLNSSLLPVMRFMLVFGLLIILFLISLLDSTNSKLKSLITILASSMLAFNLGLAFLLDYPLSGTISATPTPFTKGVLAQFNPEKKSVKRE